MGGEDCGNVEKKERKALRLHQGFCFDPVTQNCSQPPSPWVALLTTSFALALQPQSFVGPY